jgi:prepilin-type N-terminal cleavage/methylation domain-containing protein
MKNIRSQRGFTLVEIIVTLTVMTVLLGGVTSFYLQNIKSMYAAEQRMKLAGQIKKFSNELIVQASRSNQFILFKSAAPADFDGTNTAPDANNSDRQIINVADPLNPLHPAGDFVVFVYYEIPKPVTEPFHRITKLEGYFLAAPAAGVPGPVQKVVIDLSASPSTASVEAILTANWATAKFTTYFPLTRGLATPEVIDGTPVANGTTPTSRLFYMSDARNVIITGQIYTSGPGAVTGDRNTFTDSFFFTITPRT